MKATNWRTKPGQFLPGLFESRATETLLRSFDRLEHGSLELVLPDGTVHTFSGCHVGPHAQVSFHDLSAIMAFGRGDVGLAESYRDGHWDTQDINSLFRLGLLNADYVSAPFRGSWLSKLVSRYLYAFNANTLKGSKRNIQAHYDIGNSFYKLWLDPTMTYSSALFKAESESLETAQLNKYDAILDAIEEGPPVNSLLEIGSGWGGFAERALTRMPIELTGLTLSDEQLSYAQKRLGDAARFCLQDYRLHKAKPYGQLYDRIVSIEMFEAVGKKYWATYFEKLASLLSSNGKAIIQTITIGEEHFETYQSGDDMIRTFIFPGGMLPTLQVFNQQAERAGLKARVLRNFGQDYERTLARWQANFEAALPDVLNLGLDEAFTRIWRFYLAYCRAGFGLGRTDVYQFELSHS